MPRTVRKGEGRTRKRDTYRGIKRSPDSDLPSVRHARLAGPGQLLEFTAPPHPPHPPEKCGKAVAGVLDEPFSQLIPLSGVAGPPVYIGCNRVHTMQPGGPVKLLR